MGQGSQSKALSWAIVGVAGAAVFAGSFFAYGILMKPEAANSVDGHADFSRDDVRAAVEDALVESETAQLAKGQTPQSKALSALDAKLNDLKKQNRSLIERLDAIAQAPAGEKKGEAPYVIPDRVRVEEIVSATILKAKEDEDRAEKERETQRQKERQEQRLKRNREELTKLLGLDAKQADDVMASIAAADAERMALFTRAGDRFRNGGDDGQRPDFAAAQEEMRVISDKSNAAIKNVLSAEQYQKYEQWSQDQNPMRRFFGGGQGPGGGNGPGGFGGQMGGGPGSGQGGGGGRRGGRGGNAPAGGSGAGSTGTNGENQE